MSRSYRMLCPITRALDRLGDRWTLLIIRDLHAGPMRFGELKQGLPGLASNLLTTRLEGLQADGLVDRDGPKYQLTALGRSTDKVLWELALWGGQIPVTEPIKVPGHLRLAAITLQSAMRKIAPEHALNVQLELDGEPFHIFKAEDRVCVRYGPAEAPDVIVRTRYEPMMATVGGELTLSAFRAEHVSVTGDPAAIGPFVNLMTRVMTEAFGAAP